MAVSDEDFVQCGEIIAPWGWRLEVMRDPDRKKLKDGLYIVSKAAQRKWVLSIYRNVLNHNNDLEMAIDIKALVNQDPAEHQRALIWLENAKVELQHEESPLHITSKRIKAFEIGFKTVNAHSFLKRLETQINHASISERWAIKRSALMPVAQRLPPLAEKQAPPQPTKKQLLVNRMLEMAYLAEKQSGRETIAVAKTKEVKFASENEFRAYVAKLMTSELCAITGLRLDESMEDPELMPSLDRIDSSRDYEPGNLQVVARFVNRWKSDDNAANFARLLKLIRF